MTTAILALVLLQAPDSSAALAARVEIVRTEYGVPHILAEDLKSMGFGLGWVQSEDYGSTVALALAQSRGTYARYVGRDSIDGDFGAREAHDIAVETFHRLDPRTQDVYEGFAQGVNHWVRTHPSEVPAWLTPAFTAIDAHARDVQTWSRGDGARFARLLERRIERTGSGAGADGAEREAAALAARARTLEAVELAREGGGPDAERWAREDAVGSNAWALAPSRTTSGRAILLRNPHLSWDAGYYEAHVRVPGGVDFYGDFRIGGAFGIIGGFNRHVAWATTNNSPTYSQVYALRAHPDLEDHAVLDGAPVPLEPRSTTVDYRTADGGIGAETRTTWWTPYGPVIHRTDDRVWILKDPRHGEFRRGEQFLKMMLATNLEEWLDVMRMRAHSSSNFTYADADGNIALYYNARLPSLPHPPTGDTAAVAESADDIWSELVPWEDLPLYVNPPGGYVLQSNDTPDYINLNVALDRDTVAPNLPEPRFRLRSQLSYDLIHGDARLGLDDVLALKHSPRMLLAERVLDDLLRAVDDLGAGADLAEAVRVLRAWDRSAAAPSRGGVLFERWANEYLGAVDDERAFRESWSTDRPTTTPSGIGAPGEAVAALYVAVGTMRANRLALDVPWGDVHRVIRGDVDLPVSGCQGAHGCFRTLSFRPTRDGRLAVSSGDGWILAVELGGPEPVARSVLAYGQSDVVDSPHHDDQAELFARQETKAVAWTDADIARLAIRRYRPGDQGARPRR